MFCFQRFCPILLALATLLVVGCDGGQKGKNKDYDRPKSTADLK